MSTHSGRGPVGGKYSEQFRAEAVAMVTELGKSQAEVGRDLEVSHGTMSRWVRQAKTRAPGMTVSAGQAELEAENRRLRMENEFLKKAAAFFATESR